MLIKDRQTRVQLPGSALTATFHDEQCALPDLFFRSKGPLCCRCRPFSFSLLTRVRFVLITREFFLSVVYSGALSSRASLVLGFLPWEALFVRADERSPEVSRPLTTVMNLLSVRSVTGS